MKRSSIWWLFSIGLLIVVLIISIFLGVSGYFFSISYINSNSDLVIGDSFSINVLPNQSSVASFTFDGTYLPNEKMSQIVQINATNLDKDVKVRVKAEIFGVNEEVFFDFVTTEHFEKMNDDYYYFDDVLKGGNKITFCNYIVMPQQGSFKNKEKYIMTFVVETLDATLDFKNIWQLG